ncbi:MAG: hypothetical protein ACLS9P_03820 [Haemophilus parainfluenzae]
MKKLFLIILSASALSACVTQSSLQKDTAFKLGVDASQVQISNFNNGVEGTYNADVAGKKYNCKVVGVISAGVTDVECWLSKQRKKSNNIIKTRLSPLTKVVTLLEIECLSHFHIINYQLYCCRYFSKLS